MNYLYYAYLAWFYYNYYGVPLSHAYNTVYYTTTFLGYFLPKKSEKKIQEDISTDWVLCEGENDMCLV